MAWEKFTGKWKHFDRGINLVRFFNKHEKREKGFEREDYEAEWLYKAREKHREYNHLKKRESRLRRKNYSY